MGIDVYMNWKNMTKAEKEAQYTGFSTISGHVGYLREAYHGSPYVTHYLVQESFEQENYLTTEDHEYGIQIPAKTLRERLPIAICLSFIRDNDVYSETTVLRYNDDLSKQLKNVVEQMDRVFKSKGEDEADILKDVDFSVLSEILNDKNKVDKLPDHAKSFVDFVNLAEQKEKETGEPVRIYASY